MNAPVEATRFGSGKAVRRIEDPALVTGRGRFTDDVAPAGQVHLAFARSTYAHARILSIDVDGALALPGVLAVYTGADLVAAGVKPLPGGGFKRPDGSPGVLTATHYNATHGAFDGFTLTHASTGLTVTQAPVTRNADGDVTVKPPLEVN